MTHEYLLLAIPAKAGIQCLSALQRAYGVLRGHRHSRACSVGTFVLANGASYFLRSDDFGLHVVADGIRSCGLSYDFLGEGRIHRSPLLLSRPTGCGHHVWCHGRHSTQQVS